MVVLYWAASTGCTRARERAHADVSSAPPLVTPSPTSASHDVAMSPSSDGASAKKSFKQAIIERNFELAAHLLDASPPPVSPAMLTLMRGYLALQMSQPEAALRQLTDVGTTLTQLTAWLAELRVEALSQSTTYTRHLDEILRSSDFEHLAFVCERLLNDGSVALAERVLSAAQQRAVGERAQGEVRWLRARLRYAQGRSKLADADVRWLLVSHPDHPRAPDALLAIENGWFTPLTPREQISRAYAAAENGLVETVEHSLASLGDGKTLPPGERAYLLGLALYRARRFQDAIAPLDDAVRLQAPRRDQARYLAAIATSRGGRPKEALPRFSLIAAARPISESVENATFKLGHEESLLGNWSKAAEYHGAFLSQFPHHALAQDAYREQLIAWFAEANYRRFIYWVRIFLDKYPEAHERLLMRGLEGLALQSLGHEALARAIWEEVARIAPLSFAGIAARQRLAKLGVTLPLPVTHVASTASIPQLELPQLVWELDLLGLSEHAESALRSQEKQVARQFPRQADAAVCEAYGKLERGQRRYEFGRSLAPRLGLRDAPHRVPEWLWPCLYPTPYPTTVREQARLHDVSPSWIYAVMRQESAFRERATSGAGARGLMQLIDPTARKIAAELGRAYDANELVSPYRNIEFGAFYLDKLFTHFSHPALVVAAYNAGPDAAARWYAAGRTLPLEAFITRIPYDETRAYVQRVLENWVVYSTLENADATVDIPLEFTAVDPGAREPIQHRAPDNLY